MKTLTDVGHLQGIRHVTAAGLAAVLGFALASCGHDETKSASPPLSPSGTSNSPAITLARLEIDVPLSVPPGESVQFKANAVMSDASVQDVTSLAQWTVSSPDLLEISATGVAKGLKTGEGMVRTRYQTRTASKTVMVVPAGNYRLQGHVTDDGQSLGGLTVSVIGGVGEGVTAVTVLDGAYVLYGVGGHVRLQAKRDGYVNKIEELDVPANRTFDFEMLLERPRQQLQGNYTLTLQPVCLYGSLTGVNFPRSYDATVVQNGGRLTVRVSGSDFIVTGGHGDHFSGGVDGTNTVKLSILSNCPSATPIRTITITTPELTTSISSSD